MTITKPSLHVQLVVGSQEEFDGHVHCDADEEPDNEYVLFGHVAVRFGALPTQYWLGRHDVHRAPGKPNEQSPT